MTRKQDGNPPKRAISEPVPRQCKQQKIKSDAQIQQIEQIADAGEETDRSKDLGKNNLPKVLPKDCSVEELPIDNNDKNGPTKPQEMQNKPLWMGLIFGGRDGTVICKNVNKLPYVVQTELMCCFDAM